MSAAVSAAVSVDDPTPTPSPTAAPTRLVLIRHGESNVTVERRIGGHRSCSGLSELGRRQAKRLADRLAESGELRPDVVYSSQYPRALETAEVLNASFGLPIEVDAGFGEHDPGPDLDGITFDDYVQRFGVPEWHGDPHTAVFPGGETTAEFQLRVGATVSRVLGERRGSTILVSCHGGVVDAVFRLLLRLPATGGFDLHTLNTSITEFVLPADRQHGSRWQLTRYNDAAHLAGLPAATPRA